MKVTENVLNNLRLECNTCVLQIEIEILKNQV